MKAKQADPAKVDAIMELLITRKFTFEEMVALNSVLVRTINGRSRVRRLQAAAKFGVGDYVRFQSKKYNCAMKLKVDKITPGGTLYGHTRFDVPWKVSSTLCVKTDAKDFDTD